MFLSCMILSKLIRLIPDLLSFFQGVFHEGRRVVWPGRRDVVLTSIIVFVITSVFSVFFFIIDQGLAFLVQWILGVSGNV